MSQFGPLNKSLIIMMTFLFISTSPAAPLCVELFSNTFVSNKLAWTESDTLVQTTKYPSTDRWNDREILLKLSDGKKVYGRIKTFPYVYAEPNLQSGIAQSAKSEFVFSIDSHDQAQKVVEEIHSRHKKWLAEGKKIGKIYEGRQDLPTPGPDQLIRFEISESSVRILFEYSGEPSISATVSQEFIKALLFTGVTIDTEAVRPRQYRRYPRHSSVMP